MFPKNVLRASFNPEVNCRLVLVQLVHRIAQTTPGVWRTAVQDVFDPRGPTLRLESIQDRHLVRRQTVKPTDHHATYFQLAAFE
jgi:hypothetical protein